MHSKGYEIKINFPRCILNRTRSKTVARSACKWSEPQFENLTGSDWTCLTSKLSILLTPMSNSWWMLLKINHPLYTDEIHVNTLDPFNCYHNSRISPWAENYLYNNKGTIGHVNVQICLLNIFQDQPIRLSVEQPIRFRMGVVHVYA